MKQWTTLPLALVLVGALACGQDNRTAKDGAIGTTGAADAAREGAADIEQNFIEDQLGDGQAEVELGRLAQERASHADVREFASMMVRDHTRSGEKLKAIASKHNIRMDPAGHEDHNEMRERLSKLSGAAFDRAYMDAMVDDHNEAVREVEDKAEGSDNPQVKAWAAESLPVLKKHQERAKQIRENLDNDKAR